MGVLKRIWSDDFGGTKKYKVIHVNEKTGEALVQETDTLGTTVRKVAATAVVLTIFAAILGATSKER